MRKPAKRTAPKKTKSAPTASKKKTPKTKSAGSTIKKTKAKVTKVKATKVKATKVRAPKATTKKKTARAAKGIKSVSTSLKPRTENTLALKTVSRKKDIKSKPKKRFSLREKTFQNIKLDLLKQKASLLDEAEIALNELPGQTIFPDLGDQASAETDRNFMLRLRGREQRLLKKIEEAIDRIDDGMFGVCDDCGKEIDIKRLVARPVTTMCIECKTLQEEEEKLRAS